MRGQVGVAVILLLALAAILGPAPTSATSIATFDISGKMYQPLSMAIDGTDLYIIDVNGALARVDTPNLHTKGIEAISTVNVFPFSSGGCCGNFAGSYGIVIKNEYAWVGGTYNVGYALSRVSLADLTVQTFFQAEPRGSAIGGLVADSNYIYASTSFGVARFHQTEHSWEMFVTDGGPGNMMLDGDTLWYGRNPGIGRVYTNGTGLTLYTSGFSSNTGFLTKAIDGRIWFTENRAHKIGVFDPSDARAVEYDFGGFEDGPAGLTFDTNGKLWVAGFWNRNLRQFDPVTGSWVTGRDRSFSGAPFFLLKDGDKVWGDVTGPASTLFEIQTTPPPSYTPGVISSDWARYGQTNGSWSPGLPPAPPFSDFQNTNWIVTNISRVSGKEVMAVHTWNFNNATGTRTPELAGNLMTGTGNLTFWVIAGGLNAGDQIYDDPTAPIINSTVTKNYMGADRSVNILNITLTIRDFGVFGFFKGTWFWDQLTGVLLEFSFFESISSPYFSGTGSGYAIITETNLWTVVPPPDFTISASPEQLTIIAGSSASSSLTITSRYGFSGNVFLSTSPTAVFTVSPVPTSLTLAAGQSETATITIAVESSVPQGVYTVETTATSGSVSDAVQVRVTVTPVPPAPGFTLTVSSAALTVQPGNTGTLTIAITPNNGFVGEVTLSSSAPAGIIVSLDPPRLTGSGGSTIAVSVESTLASGTYSLALTASSGGNTQTLTITINVTTPPRSPRASTIFGLEPILFYSGIVGVVSIALVIALFITWKRLRSQPASGGTIES